MIDVKAQIVGIDSVSLRLADGDTKARAVVRRAVQGLGLELLRKVSQDFLTGQSLKVQSGRLRRSINEQTTASGDVITSSVGTNVVYGRTWELGFSGSEQVKAHVRRMGRKGVVAQVRAFSRNVNKRPRPFLRPALEQMRGRARSRIEEALRGL